MPTEPLIEQLTAWVAETLDGATDAHSSFTLSAKRPRDIDWSISSFSHADAIIEEVAVQTVGANGANRVEEGKWTVYGIIRDNTGFTSIGTLTSRMSETIRSKLLAGNTGGRACNGLAVKIDCPTVEYASAQGCTVVSITVVITYATDYKATYA